MNRNSRLEAALLPGVLSFFLLFLLGQGTRHPSTVPGAEYLHGLTFIGGIGGCFLISTCLLSRGDPHAIRKGWPLILALNTVLLLTTLVAWFVEPGTSAVLATASTALLALVCSFAGAAVAGRAERPRGH